MSNSWSHRNAAVVPWISLRNQHATSATAHATDDDTRSTDLQYVSTTTSSSTFTAAKDMANRKNHVAKSKSSSCRILSLLSARERIGLHGQSSSNRVGWLNEGVVVTNDGLARAGAWNPRRLQNMTLAIGPGTPASCVLLSNGHGNDDDDDDDDSSSDVEEENDNEMQSVADSQNNENNTDIDGEEEGSEDSKVESNEDDSSMEILPTTGDDDDAELCFDDSGRLVPVTTAAVGAVGAREPSSEFKAETDIAPGSNSSGVRNITQSPGDGEQVEREEEQSPSRRSRWERTQRSILDALNGSAGNDDDDVRENEDNDSDDDSDDDNSHNSNNSSSSGNTSDARDRYTIRQVEEYIDHLETLGRRHERRASLSSFENQQHVGQVRPVARSMKHGGCINTVSWLDCGWRISTASNEDAHAARSNHDYWYEDDGDGGFLSSSSSYSSGNEIYSDQRPRRKSQDGGLGGCNNGSLSARPLAPTEYPTQLLTSGDDHLVKFWDVSASMGSASPLPGGSATITPFSSPRMPMRACSELVDTWKNHGQGYYLPSSGTGNDDKRKQHRRHMPGVVHPLLTLSTGHRGNVFHASPVPHTIGKIATCAADGFLRLLDVETSSCSSSSSTRNRSNSNASSSESSTIVLSPEYHENNGESDPMAFRFRSSLMCFSHHFLSANVGLVCSERGLLHFDLRLPPRSQRRGSLIPELSDTCKACFPWRGGRGDGDLNECMESSAYVFAGGSGVEVGLYDLRMTASYAATADQAVQKYRPRALKRKSLSSSVAVSGIDVSKDERELLVSYESDHVYTFPIFDGKDHPTMEDIDGCGMEDDDKPVSELAAYGGHLNRLTFLKMAKYAGPNDEYICTGSDSGHAWIYEKKSSTVVSFMKADNSTCNGIQPHPSLPYFITYGIDSTAKLWRATTPVDKDVDDSDMGRFDYSKTVKYEKSIVCDQWKKARKGKEVDLFDDGEHTDGDEMPFFPDETNEDDNDDPDHFLGVFLRSRLSREAPFIGNDMTNLNSVLAKNYFTCARSVDAGDGGDEPVKSGLSGMKRRVSLIKLRHQSDRLGLAFDSVVPWMFKFKDHLLKQSLNSEDNVGSDKSGAGNSSMVSYGCLADLIPDNPSDWIPFDGLLAVPPRPGGMSLNVKYEGYCLESSEDRSVAPVYRACCPIESEAVEDNSVDDEGGHAIGIDKVDGGASKLPHSIQANEKSMKSPENRCVAYDSSQSWDILYQTVALLKEAGNKALKASLPFLAARRYDKAINYCSLAYLSFPVGPVDFLAEHQYVISKNGGYECRWNELIKTLVMIRLNLAMCFLKQEINDAKGAMAQANLSLKELKPFATEKGVVLTGKKLTKKRADEPIKTYNESKALQAKAYFRLGSSQILLKEYDDAVKSFDLCVGSTNEAGMTVDAAVMRKINEAKRRRKEKKELQRKKFKFMFSSNEKEVDSSKGTTEVGSG